VDDLGIGYSLPDPFGQIEALLKAIDFNGGWWVVYSDHVENRIGDVLPETCFPKGSPRCVVIDMATEEEARAECAHLGMSFLKAKHYYKAMAD